MRGVGVSARTDARVCVAQHHKKKTLNPTWNEHFHLLVQEPKTQAVRLQVYDWDGIHLKASTAPCSPDIAQLAVALTMTRQEP